MANEEQVKILKQGVEVWNKWRKKNLNTRIDLSLANLSRIDLIEADLSEANLSGANLKKAILRGGDLRRAQLKGAYLEEADFDEANLAQAELASAVLTSAYLREANLSGADLSNADLSDVTLRGSNLSDSNLTNVKLWQAQLQGANLSKVILRRSNLEFANLFKVNLTEADLRETNFNRSELRDANLKKANLRGADLIGTNLIRADLSEANLTRTNLTDAQLSETRLTKTLFSETILVSTDLSEVADIENAIHLGPSFLGIDTLHRSKGKIPEIFLRGCGLNNLDIEYAKLAVLGLDSDQVTDIAYKIHHWYLGKGIQYYSCFISYSSKDQEFAQHLHDDLQNSGVRCWFDREDLKIGDQIRPTIDRQIRIRDKLLVILSENSVKSEWVGDEVEGALEEESKSNRLVLFPISLDDTVMNTRDDWVAKIKRRRHIGDFSNWKDKASYQKAFERLLRDLKATGGNSAVGGE